MVRFFIQILLASGLWIPAAAGSTGGEAYGPLSALSQRAACSACIGFDFESGGRPPFRAGERDTTRLRASGLWALGPRGAMRIQAERLWMNWPSGDQVSGWGDLRLGSMGLFMGDGKEGVSVGVDWGVKLPNAADQGELGSDESDAHAGLFGVWRRNAWEVGLSTTLLILGDPLQFANQDDALLAIALAAYETEKVRWSSRVVWRENSPRNPRDVRVLAGAQWMGLPKGFWLAAEGGIGTSAYAPSWQAGIQIGLSKACRPSQRD